MPTSLPRINVTLQPSTHAVLVEMSRLTGNSRSAIIGELLAQAEPVFERVCLILRAAVEARKGANTRVLEGLREAQGIVEQHLGLVDADFTDRVQGVLEPLERVIRRSAKGGERSPGAKGGRARVAPRRGGPGGAQLAPMSANPLSNRGVRTRKGRIAEGGSGRAKRGSHA